MQAYRATAAIDPRQRLMLAMKQPAGRPNGPISACCRRARCRGDSGAGRRLRAEGWLRPDAAGRVAFSLPAEPRLQVEALRQAQRQGASAFALCPEQPALPPAPALSAAFSAATYPYRP